MRKKSGIKVIFGILITALLLSLCSLTAFAKKTETWYTSKSGKTYYYDEDGNKLKNGKYQIGKHYYYFDKKGVQRTGWQKIGKYYYYFRIKDGSKGYMKTSATVNGITLRKSGKAKMTSYAKQKLPVLYKANVKMRSITKCSDSKKQKLRKCFDYVSKWKLFKYGVNFDTNRYSGNWDIYYAKRIFVDGKKTGECNTCAACFAYLANACGYKAKVVASGGHGWAEIDNKVYDPDWASVDKKNNYFGLSYNKSGVNGVPRYKSNRRYIKTV